MQNMFFLVFDDEIVEVVFPDPIKPAPFMALVRGQQESLRLMIRGTKTDFFRTFLQTHKPRPTTVQEVSECGKGMQIDFCN